MLISGDGKFMPKDAKNILVVGSDADMCWLLKKVFQTQNCHIITSDSLADTLEAVSKKGLDLVLLDTPLTNLSTNNILKCIRNHQPNTPVIVIGPYRNDVLYSRLQEIGNYEFVAKPFVIENLVTTVKQALFPPAKSNNMKAVKNS